MANSLTVSLVTCSTSRGPCGRGESDSLVAELREERDRLRERVAVLQDDMFWFQRAAGFDFVPAKTKVRGSGLLWT